MVPLGTRQVRRRRVDPSTPNRLQQRGRPALETDESRQASSNTVQISFTLKKVFATRKESKKNTLKIILKKARLEFVYVQCHLKRGPQPTSTRSTP